MTTTDYATIVQCVLLGAMVISALLHFYRKKPGAALSHGAIWLMVAFVAVTFYANQNSLKAVLYPGFVEQKGAGILAVRAAADGHFYLNADINGQPVRFMVDTGASSIILPLATARRLGFKPETLDFTASFQTANGEIFAAPITLETLEISGHLFTNVSAFVNQGELKTPLLGLRFLDRARNIEIREDELIIAF